MKSKGTLITLAVIGITLIGNAQSAPENQEKYWDYRHRLDEQFLIIGEGPGKSLPAESIEPDVKRIRFADATVYLGWYITMLSTEYYLSSKNAYLRSEGEPIEKEQTLLQLYYALKAFERLDQVAEPFFAKTASPDMNGFFIRDDVPHEMKKKFGMKLLDSDGRGEENIFNNEMSHDQAYHILMGMMAVKNLIPENTQVKGVKIRQMAIDNGVRVIMWMKENGWHVKNSVIKKNGKKLKKVARGSEGYIYSQGMNRVLKALTDGQLNESNKVKILNKFFWGSMRMGIHPAFMANDNRHMAMSVAAIGNGWKKKSFRKLSKRAKSNEWYAYPLLNKMLFPTNKVFKKKSFDTEVESLLNRAPTEGPDCPYPDRYENGWGVNNMFLKDYDYQREGKSFHQGRHYNGLDYMVLYNLQLIHRKGLRTN